MFFYVPRLNFFPEIKTPYTSQIFVSNIFWYLITMQDDVRIYCIASGNIWYKWIIIICILSYTENYIRGTPSHHMSSYTENYIRDPKYHFSLIKSKHCSSLLFASACALLTWYQSLQIMLDRDRTCAKEKSKRNIVEFFLDPVCQEFWRRSGPGNKEDRWPIAKNVNSWVTSFRFQYVWSAQQKKNKQRKRARELWGKAYEQRS